MAKTKQLKSQEKFKTMIGGQALIEGIMMRGPDKDAVVVRGKEGLTVEVTPRKLPPEHSPLRWPLIRGIYNFFGSNIVGVKALMRSADLSPEEGETEAPSKFDQWLEKKLGNEGFQKALVGFAVVLAILAAFAAFDPAPDDPAKSANLSVDENGNVVEKGKKIIVRMPQKGVFEAIKDVEANGTGEDADTSTIYNLVAAVLNNNMGNVKVSAEEVESYDIEECTAILKAYMEFVDELKQNPN